MATVQASQYREGSDSSHDDDDDVSDEEGEALKGCRSPVRLPVPTEELTGQCCMPCKQASSALPAAALHRVMDTHNLPLVDPDL